MRGDFPANVALPTSLVLAMMTTFFRAVMRVMEVGAGAKAEILK
ncbi:MAG: hypothetical protein Q8O52_11270 [Sulfuritalea sp.]|nr:hypothetical protein [Sulfuritalea sp.]